MNAILKRATNRNLSHLPQRRLALTIVAPAILYYLLLRYYPVGRTLYLSFTDARLLSPTYDFVGAQNFANLLGDPVFRKVLWNTTYYAFVTTTVTTVLAFLVALLFDPIRRGVGMLRLIYYLPTVTSAIAIATIWIWFYQPRFGLFNQILAFFSIPPISWLRSTEWAMPSLIIMSVWGGVGFSALIFIAGLKGIPNSYIEAARIDGAAPWQVAWHIKLPLLSRVITFVYVTGVIGSFQVFQQVYLMTSGGPLNATRVLALAIYEDAFQHLKIGQAAATAFVLFVVVGVLTVIQLRIQRNDWEL